MRFDEHQFQMLSDSSTHAPDGLTSKHEIATHVSRILGELILIPESNKRLPCKAAMNISNYFLDEVKSESDLTDGIISLCLIIFGIIRERFTLQAEIPLATQLKDIFDESVLTQLAFELTSMPYSNTLNINGESVPRTIDFSSLSLFGDEFKLETKFNNFLFDFLIADDDEVSDPEVEKPIEPPKDADPDDSDIDE